MRSLPTVLTALVFWATGCLHAQQWEPVGHGRFATPGSIYSLFGDSVADRLWAGGTAKWYIDGVDTLTINGVGRWDGNSWDTLPNSLQICNGNVCQQMYDFIRYQGRLLANGSFSFIDEVGLWQNNFAALNETTMAWEGVGCNESIMNGIATFMNVPTEDTLLFTGYQGTMCGLNWSNVFAYDGSNFHTFQPFQAWPGDEDYVGFVFKFKGIWYLTGLLHDDITDETRGFMRYTGTSWEPVPGFETPAPIKDFLIHNDTLYMCGYFYEGPGSPGNLVTMYDGENWSNLGGGLTFDQQNQGTFANAFDMLWWHDKLYVAGLFFYAGGVPAENIAQWDGHRWCGTGANMVSSDPRLHAMTTWRDTLYIAGGFESIDGVPMNRVAKWNGGDFDAVCSPSVGVQEHVSRTVQLSLQPNPANDFLTLRCANHHQGFLSVTDALGRVVLRMPWQDEPVDVRGLSNGVYQVLLRDEQELPVASGMFVKQ